MTPVADDTLAGPRKSDATRAAIVDAALRLFAERGYDRTTMRAIAVEAGVSVGNAYYYFASKDHLVHGFYHRIGELHALAAMPVLASERDLGARLHGVLNRWLDVASPYHEFGAQFFKNAADPASPLSPFSAESAEVREAALRILRDVVDGSTATIDPALRAELPQLLWLYQMGIVLFWVHDRSVGQERTRMLVERTVPLISRVIGLSRLSVVRPLIQDTLRLLHDLFPVP